MNAAQGKRGLLFLPVGAFLGVFVAHAVYIRHVSTALADGWAHSELMNGGWAGFGAYLQSQDYYTGFSYGLGAAFAVWAVARFVRSRQAAMGAGAAGGVTLVGVLMATGCFLVGCCGSPMLGVYSGILGAKALGLGKPLMAIVTLLSVSCGYWCLSHRDATASCPDGCCGRVRAGKERTPLPCPESDATLEPFCGFGKAPGLGDSDGLRRLRSTLRLVEIRTRLEELRSARDPDARFV